MEFRVLGPLHVTHAGLPVVVTRRKCQAFLALLLSRYPYALTADSIAEALWPDSDPERAVNSVRVHATYLRKALAVGNVPGSVGSGRYRMTVSREQIDATRLEDFATAGREAAAAGNPHLAAELFRTALSDWRGDPYADFPEIDALREERTRLSEVRLDVLEGYASALLDDDRADEVCRLLTPVVDANLNRETLVARAMLGLHRTGRQHESLALFGRVKEELGERGIPPTPALQELANAIVLQDPALEVSRRESPAGSRTGSRPGRPVLQPRRRAAFVGRDAELYALSKLWDAAAWGTPQLAYVFGAAGIGKTTIAARLAAQVRGDGGTALVGQCDPDPAENYQPFPDFVRMIMADAPPTDSSPRLLGELARLAPDLTERLPPMTTSPNAGAGRQRLFAAVSNLLGTPAQPRLIVIEDLHWARPDALLLLRHVLRNARGQIMVVGTYRGDEIGPETPFGAAAVTGRLARPDLRLALPPMDRHEISAVIDAVAPRDRRAEWLGDLDELVTVSAGNPLRLREVLRQLELEPETPVADIAPEDVRSLVERRLRSLDPGAQSVLQHAAVFGRAFTLLQVALATGLLPEFVLDALEASIAQGLVLEGEHIDDFTFAHPLFRNAIYTSLSNSRRARIHLRCGELLAGEGDRDGTEGRTAEVARHFVAARPVSDAARTAGLTRAAADDAATRYAHEEASDWYRHSLECAMNAGWSERDCARLHLDLGTALDRAGLQAEAREEFFFVAEVAKTIADSELLIDAVVAATPRSTVIDPGFAPRLAGIADEALAMQTTNDPARVQLLRSAAYARFASDPESAEAYAIEAERLAQHTSDPQVRSWAIAIRYLTRVLDDDLRLPLSRQLARHSARHHLVNDRGIDTRRFLIDLMIHGRMDEFDRELDAMSHLARSTAIPYDLYWVAALTATRHLMRDASSTGEELINGAALLGRQLQVFDAPGVQLLQTFSLRYQQGRARELTAGLAAPDTSEPRVVAGSALLALSLAAAGRLDPARRLLDRVVTDDDIALPKDSFRHAAVALFGGVAAACGSPGQRRVLRRAIESRANRFCVFGAGGAVFGTGHHWLARLAVADGDLDTARDYLAEAARICHDADAAFWAERALSETAAIDRDNP